MVPCKGVAARRDDSAWPRWAVPASLAIIALTLGGGLAIVAAEDVHVVAGACLVTGVLVGLSLMVVAIRRWLAGREIPGWLGLAGAIFMVGGMVGTNAATGTGAGVALMAGMIAGLMMGNIWAIHAARANRSTASR